MSARTTRVRRRPAARARRGMSLVEMLVAVVILVIGVLGLAATAAMVTRQMGGGAQQTTAAALAQARFERLTAGACTALLAAPSGTVTTRGITEKWAVADGGSGRTLVMRDTLSYPTSRGVRRQAYQSMRVC